jgi:hypothetical protein
MRRILLTLLPALVLGAAACETPMGPGTDGPMVFEARVAQQGWPPAGKVPAFTANLSPEQTLTIAAAIRDSGDHPREILGLSIPGFHGPARYRLTGAPNEPWGLFQRRAGSATTTYVTRGTGTSAVTISAIDTLAHVAAGTFQFTGYRPGTDESLTIGRGTFRVHYTVGTPGTAPVESGPLLSNTRGAGWSATPTLFRFVTSQP